MREPDRIDAAVALGLLAVVLLAVIYFAPLTRDAGPSDPRGPPGEDGRDGLDGRDALPWFGATFRVRFTCRLADCADLRMDLYGDVAQYDRVRYVEFIQDETFQTHAPENRFVVLWNGSGAMTMTLRFHVVDTGYSTESPAYVVRNGSAWILWEVSVR